MSGYDKQLARIDHVNEQAQAELADEFFEYPDGLDRLDEICFDVMDSKRPIKVLRELPCDTLKALASLASLQLDLMRAACLRKRDDADV
jgi:hypothetical protein